MDYPNSNLLVEADWLKQHLTDVNLRLLDVRASDPRLPVGYRMGHIPGAIQLDPAREFFVMANRMRDLAPAEKIAQTLGARGIANDSAIVIYDEWTGTLATYAYWLLKYFGHRDVKILHGGWAAWKKAGGAMTADAPQFPATNYLPQPNAAVRATAEWIQANATRGDLFLLDTRSEGEYSGGHIPGAHNLPHDASLDLTTQTFKDAATLKAQLESVGATLDKEVVVYCASGARSSHMFAALQLLGYVRARNYDGSMMDWAQARGLPME
ncbi:MAG: sulfurtransferase [Chloroflexi bacterium]|nr:sulfurtransferase [Chloroflexota bacterium]